MRESELEREREREEREKRKLIKLCEEGYEILQMVIIVLAKTLLQDHEI